MEQRRSLSLRWFRWPSDKGSVSGRRIFCSEHVFVDFTVYKRCQNHDLVHIVCQSGRDRHCRKSRRHSYKSIWWSDRWLGNFQSRTNAIRNSSGSWKSSTLAIYVYVAYDLLPGRQIHRRWKQRTKQVIGLEPDNTSRDHNHRLLIRKPVFRQRSGDLHGYSHLNRRHSTRRRNRDLQTRIDCSWHRLVEWRHCFVHDLDPAGGLLAHIGELPRRCKFWSQQLPHYDAEGSAPLMKFSKR